MNNPLFRQLFVASAAQLAAISSGAVISFPNVLFQQLNRNDSTIHLDIHTTSWIGSVHVLAGLIACIIPLAMQYKGRKLIFILCCMIHIIGWITAYFSQSATALIIAEALHGVSGNSVMICSMLAVSEMLHPRFRIIAMNAFIFNQILGISMMILLGRYFHWKTVCCIACCPIIIAVLIGFAWPESPVWLAYNGDYEKCEKIFIWLRGSNADSHKELNQIICAHKEKIKQKKFNPQRQSVLFQRDFYLPCFHVFVLLYTFYWGGITVVLIYSVSILQAMTSSDSASSDGVLIMYSILLVGNAIGLVFVKYFKTKTLILSCGMGVVICMALACITSYLQYIKLLSADSRLCMYCLIGYIVSFNLGACTTIPSLSNELIPVKHRGIGGTAYIIMFCLIEFTSLKASPYLFVYINYWGAFLLYTINVTLGMLVIWKYIPETKNRTLQDIEDYYNHGSFQKASTDNNCDVLENMKGDRFCNDNEAYPVRDSAR